MPILIHSLLLAAHIGGGGLALAAGCAAMVAAKGGRIHRLAGRVFAGCMLAIIAAALVLAVMRPNPFLFLVGVFSAYLVAVGWRAGRIRDGVPRWQDWALAGTMTAAVAGMLGWGGWQVAQGQSFPGPVLLLFGGIGGTLAIGDLARFRRGRMRPQQRLVRHLTHMLGGFVAAWTAVLVVNGAFLPPLVRWSAPTMLLVPLTVYWRRRLAPPPSRPVSGAGGRAVAPPAAPPASADPETCAARRSPRCPPAAPGLA